MQHHAAWRKTVDIRAADDHQHGSRDGHDCKHGPEREAATGHDERQPWQSDERELVAETGDASSDPQQTEVAESEYFHWYLRPL